MVKAVADHVKLPSKMIRSEKQDILNHETLKLQTAIERNKSGHRW